MRRAPVGQKVKIPLLKSTVVRLEDRYQGLVRRTATRWKLPVQADVLPGIVMGGVAHVQGRMLLRRGSAEGPIRTASTKLQLLRSNIAPFITFEVAGAAVLLHLGNSQQKVVTDREGYFVGALDASDLEPGRHQVTATPTNPTGEPGHAFVHVPHPDVDVAVVSDIDDTIVDSGVAHGALTTLKTVLLSDSSTRVPLKGAPELYRALAKSANGADRPFVYLSTSPWNLGAFLLDFLARHRFPSGSLVLTDWGPGEHGLFRISGCEHKLAALRTFAKGLPEVQFVLLGDSGQADPRIYATFVSEHPHRVAAVYIRKAGELTTERQRQLDECAAACSEAGISFLVADDSEAIMEHARSTCLLA